MLNIVIPMAGRGSRFADAGYKVPKPLIDVNGKPMIEVVTDNIRPTCDHRFIYICQAEHLVKYDLEKELKRMVGDPVIITIDHMMIANSDQYVDTVIDEYLEHLYDNDGLIMTMPANHPKWSYIKYDDNGFVTEVREKEVISNEATVGIYNYKHGRDFVKYAHQMIDKNIRVNNEFYVAPVYNEMIADGKKIVYCNVGQKMHGLGTPEDLNLFLSLKR